MDQELINVLTTVTKLKATSHAYRAIEQDGIITVQDLRAYPYDDEWEYDDNGTIHDVKESQALKIKQIIAYAKSKVDDNAPDAENPTTWTEVEFDTWRASK
jgi:hypothetical protein